MNLLLQAVSVCVLLCCVVPTATLAAVAASHTCPIVHPRQLILKDGTTQLNNKDCFSVNTLSHWQWTSPPTSLEQANAMMLDVLDSVVVFLFDFTSKDGIECNNTADLFKFTCTWSNNTAQNEQQFGFQLSRRLLVLAISFLVQYLARPFSRSPSFYYSALVGLSVVFVTWMVLLRVFSFLSNGQSQAVSSAFIGMLMYFFAPQNVTYKQVMDFLFESQTFGVTNFIWAVSALALLIALVVLIAPRLVPYGKTAEGVIFAMMRFTSLVMLLNMFFPHLLLTIAVWLCQFGLSSDYGRHYISAFSWIIVMKLWNYVRSFFSSSSTTTSSSSSPTTSSTKTKTKTSTFPNRNNKNISSTFPSTPTTTNVAATYQTAEEFEREGREKAEASMVALADSLRGLSLPEYNKVLMRMSDEAREGVMNLVANGSHSKAMIASSMRAHRDTSNHTMQSPWEHHDDGDDHVVDDVDDLFDSDSDSDDSNSHHNNNVSRPQSPGGNLTPSRLRNLLTRLSNAATLSNNNAQTPPPITVTPGRYGVHHLEDQSGVGAGGVGMSSSTNRASRYSPPASYHAAVHETASIARARHNAVQRNTNNHYHHNNNNNNNNNAANDYHFMSF